MPKLTPIKTIARGPGDIVYQNTYECSVLSDGTFQAVVPDDHAEVVQSLLGDRSIYQNDKTTISKSRRTEKWVVQSNTKADLERLLFLYAKSKVETTKESDLLIFYKLADQTSYVTNSAGEVFPNGGFCPDDYQWRGSHPGSAGASNSYAIGVSASIVKRVIHRLPNGKFHVTSERPNDDEIGEWGMKLRGFTHTPWPGSDFWSKEKIGERRWTDINRFALQFMPYDEEKAAFFYTMMMKLCQLAEGFRLFMGDTPDHLSKALSDDSARRMIGYNPVKTDD